MVAENELTDRREDRIEGVDSSYWAIKSNRENGSPPTTALRSLSHDAMEIAACDLRLGNVADAREWYVRAAIADRSYLRVFVDRWDDLLKGAQTQSGVRAGYGIISAILSGHPQLIEETAEQVLGLSDDYPSEYAGTGEYYWRACIYAALAVGDDAAARESLEQYRAYVHEEYDSPGYEAVVQIFDGLLDDDATAVRAGLDQRLQRHADSIEDISRWRDLVCHSAAASLFLARYRGMDVTVAEFDSEYLPTALDEYDIGDDFALPRPEYADESLIPD